MASGSQGAFIISLRASKQLCAASDLLALATSRLRRAGVTHGTATAASALEAAFGLLLLLLLLLLGSGLALSLGSSGRLSALLLLLLDVLSSLLDGLLDVRLGLLLLVVVRRIGVLLGLLILPGSQSSHTLRSFITDSLALDNVLLIELPVGKLADESLAAARVIRISLLILRGARLGSGDLLEAEVELDSSATLGGRLVSNLVSSA